MFVFLSICIRCSLKSTFVELQIGLGLGNVPGPYISIYKKKNNNIFFQILWKSRCDILVTFPSHLKKLHSILRF